jgi:murein tripeptide amidase MpaA
MAGFFFPDARQPLQVYNSVFEFRQRPQVQRMKISSNFDAGSIEIVSMESFDDIQLRIPRDNASDFAQWFYFRLQGAAYQACTLRFLNAGECAYPEGWTNYQLMASYDRINWFRVPAQYDGQVMTVEHVPLANSVYYAYFEPYSHEQHLNLLGQAQGSGLCQIHDLGFTVQGRDINLLTIGHEVESDLKIWVTARQHPGETMAEWFVEGFLNRLLDPLDATSRALLDKATFYVVPNMNPDGSILGNLRTNAAGANLNREWLEPSPTPARKYCWCAARCWKPALTCFWTSTATNRCLMSLSPVPRACLPTLTPSASWKTSSSTT